MVIFPLSLDVSQCFTPVFIPVFIPKVPRLGLDPWYHVCLKTLLLFLLQFVLFDEGTHFHISSKSPPRRAEGLWKVPLSFLHGSKLGTNGPTNVCSVRGIWPQFRGSNDFGPCPMFFNYDDSSDPAG